MDALNPARAWHLAVRSQPSSDWDDFVAAHPHASVYQLGGWSEIVRQVFGHAAFFIEARDSSGALIAVLPMIQQRSMLLGNFITSLPFFNYGGVLCGENQELAGAMMERARLLAEELKCSYAEFRDVCPRPGSWSVRTDKVGMVLPLPKEFGELAQRLGSKLRSQVKRAEREQTRVQIGGLELLNDFYKVLTENMRDLGTPVCTKRFFAAMLERFPEYCHLVVIYNHDRPAAAGFVVVYRGRGEIPWAACRAQAKPLGLNMKLYWEVLAFVIERGCTSFDFGRSTKDEGTYRFKKQWGAQPAQLYWHRWMRHAGGEVAHPRDGRAMALAARMWRLLPLPVANALGPVISPVLPW